MENSSNRQFIPLKDVKIPTRMRRQMGNLDGLADSIRRNGLHEPVILDEDNLLLAGERRYRAHVQLGVDSIYFVRREGLTPDQKAELEFEENFWRKAFSWQEEALGILNIYRKKKRQGALEGFEENWHLVISEMFGMSVGTINYILVVAKRLEQELALPEEERKLHAYQSVNEAYRLGILAEVEDAANTRLAELAKQQANTSSQVAGMIELIEEVQELESDPELLTEERNRYESNPLNTIPFEKYWEEKKLLVDEAKRTIYISHRFINGDCIEYMNLAGNEGRFDHIITDPPYAIVMNNLNQDQGGIVDVDRVIDAHDVGENMDLLAKFFPAAWKCTKEKAFVVVCGDVMQWQYMYDLATKTGFAVQRWPFLWRKVNQSIMNNCPAYNTTKDFEIVMLCRKPNSTLAEKENSSVCDASNVEVTRVTGHPFAKPYELTHRLASAVSLKGQLILEPFAGAGSMVIELLRMERNVIAVEKEVHHFNAMVENVKREYYLKLNPKFVFK